MAKVTDERGRPLFMISVVAELLDIHQQTLRLYEREGLVIPQRTAGNTRLYSQEDIDKLRCVLRLTRELGVNLAGVEVILSMRAKMAHMQEMMDQLIHYVQTELQKKEAGRSEQPSSALVKLTDKGIIVKFGRD
jgi:MerR family transcriptional regulator/heat shock protein HspR